MTKNMRRRVAAYKKVKAINRFRGCRIAQTMKNIKSFANATMPELDTR